MATSHSMPNIDLAEFARTRIERGSKSFALASKLFDTDTRRSAHMLYAWCRHCDDVIDNQQLGFANAPPTPQSREVMQTTVDQLRSQTQQALNGTANEPVFAALAEVVVKHAIPHKFALELIDGFQMDADQQTYATFNDTLTYCYHVAGVVGVMMAHVMGVPADDHATLNQACDLGLAFQLTNIARDVMDDAKAERCYLPTDWLADANLTGADLADPANSSALFSVVDRMLGEADRYYRSSTQGLPRLSFRSAWAVISAQKVYRQIGQDVRTAGEAAWTRRQTVSTPRKLGFVASAAGTALASRFGLSYTPPLRGDLWTYPGFR